MDFLKELEVSDETIETITRIYNPDIIERIDIYKDHIKENIVYLKSIGVNTIENILLFDMTVLFQSLASTTSMVDSIGLDKVVKELNEDPEYIRFLLK